MDETVLLSEDIGPVRRLTMNRPDKLNSLNGALVRALSEAFAAADEDDSVRVVILKAAGRAFCAGYDLEEDADAGPLDAAAWMKELKESADHMMDILFQSKPVIAQVQSYCLAGGTDLMLACDLCVCSDDAKFGYVDIRFGSGVVTMLLPWVAGVRNAKELLFTGEDRLSAAEALRMGLVNRGVAQNDLDAATVAMAEEIAKNEPFVVQAMKRSVNRAWELQGLRESIAANVELDTIIESADLPARAEFRRITEERGLKAAIAWRDARFRGEIP